ncbi:uncharacterized protein LOC117644850 [Thrips palmi]|uniref:Uncharacterized protein LOC117644850 n=1 Tax=Thrips palmi TaxID=161013 RepID=A0A6P8YTF6_THRPL|nr:uncharacterized protein LOC117644850 [Thrips palmi]
MQLLLVAYPLCLMLIELVILLGVSNRFFLREMQEVKSRCDKLAIIINKIYNCVCPVLETSQENDGRGMPKLPNSSFEELRKWEEFLQDHDNKLHVIRLLSDRCSANNLRDSVNNMLRFFLSNKLACSFNLKEKNKADATMTKVAFEGSRSWTVILASMTAFKNSVAKSGGSLHYSIAPVDVGNSVGRWLKDAPKRYLLDLKCDKAVGASCTKVPPEMLLVPPENFKLV